LRALQALCVAQLEKTRTPWQALPFINQLAAAGLVAKRADVVDAANGLLRRWQARLSSNDDYFGAARHRIEVFPTVLAPPNIPELVATQEGVLLMSGDTDDQSPVADPVFVAFDGIFSRSLTVPGQGLYLLGSTVDAQRRLWAATNRGLFLLEGEGNTPRYTQWVNSALGEEANNGLVRSLRESASNVTVRQAPLPSNRLFEVRAGPQQTLYIAADNGLVLFEPDSGRWRVFKSGQDGLPYNLRRVAALADGSIAVARWRLRHRPTGRAVA
jgi:hypothetical protein